MVKVMIVGGEADPRAVPRGNFTPELLYTLWMDCEIDRGQVPGTHLGRCVCPGQGWSPSHTHSGNPPGCWDIGRSHTDSRSLHTHPRLSPHGDQTGLTSYLQDNSVMEKDIELLYRPMLIHPWLRWVRGSESVDDPWVRGLECDDDSWVQGLRGQRVRGSES